jgi:hypothetical protein
LLSQKRSRNSSELAFNFLNRRSFIIMMLQEPTEKIKSASITALTMRPAFIIISTREIFTANVPSILSVSSHNRLRRLAGQVSCHPPAMIRSGHDRLKRAVPKRIRNDRRRLWPRPASGTRGTQLTGAAQN